jgi:PST family polysaccharide transporter
MSTNELLYPQFFFQGVENMKVSSLLNILIKLLFIGLVFIFVKDSSDYIMVPILYAVGYTIAGIISLAIIKQKYDVYYMRTSFKDQYEYFKECTPILATDLICTIKDKWNYLLIGSFVGSADVVIYDLGIKFSGIISKPNSIMSTVLLPKFATGKNKNKLKFVLCVMSITTILIVLALNIALPVVVRFFLNQEVDLLPLRVMTLIPIFLGSSVFICSDFFIAFGYNKYVLYSIIITTIGYLILLSIVWVTGYMTSLWSFIFIAIISYIVELIYRLIMFAKLT